jgi:hypothetical protein
MAVRFEGGVVIGADTRTTTGSYIVGDLAWVARFIADGVSLPLSLLDWTPFI